MRVQIRGIAVGALLTVGLAAAATGSLIVRQPVTSQDGGGVPGPGPGPGTGSNTAPTLTDGTLVSSDGDVDTTVSALAGRFTDDQGDSLTVTAIENAVQGVLNVGGPLTTGTTQVTFDVDAGQVFGTFDVTVSDGSASTTGTITVSVSNPAVNEEEGDQPSCTAGVDPSVVAPDDHGDDPGTATTMCISGFVASAAGTVHTTGDPDYMRVRLVENQHYYFDFQTSGGLTANLNLRYADNQCVKVNPNERGCFTSGANPVNPLSFTSVSSSYRHFVATDDYYLDVQPTGGTTGSWTVSVHLIADDFGSVVAEASTLNVGDGPTSLNTVSGTIEHNQDRDMFAVTFEQGSYYVINTSSDSSTTIDWRIMQNDTQCLSVSVNTYNCGTFGANAITAQSYGSISSPYEHHWPSGTYYLNTYTVSGTRPVSYSLSAYEIPDDVGVPSENTAGSVTVTAIDDASPQPVSGVIDYAGDVDFFAVDLVQGERYAFSFTKGAGLTTEFRLADDDTNCLSVTSGVYNCGTYGSNTINLESYSDRNSSYEFVWPTGTYYIRTYASHGTLPGAYSIAVERVDDDTKDTSEAVTIALSSDDVAVSGSTRFDYPGDQDYYEVALTQGRYYTFAPTNDSGLTSEWRIMENDTQCLSVTVGTYNCGTSGANAIRPEFFNALTSTYRHEWATGTYYLRATRTNAAPLPIGTAIAVTRMPDDYGSDFASATPIGTLNIGQPVTISGRIDHAQDQDWIALDLVDGAQYTFNVTENDGTNLFWDSLYHSQSECVSVARDVWNCSTFGTNTVQIEGRTSSSFPYTHNNDSDTYALMIRRDGGDGRGGWSLTVERLN